VTKSSSMSTITRAFMEHLFGRSVRAQRSRLRSLHPKRPRRAEKFD